MAGENDNSAWLGVGLLALLWLFGRRRCSRSLGLRDSVPVPGGPGTTGGPGGAGSGSTCGCGPVVTGSTCARVVQTVFPPTPVEAFAGGGSYAGSAPTGRWKIQGDGSCQYDPTDSGLDQCDPTPGRWKLDGYGGCYYDPSDTGPDQCNPF